MMFPKSVLIVEDEVITQRYLKDILTHYQIEEIVCVDNATDTLAELKEKRYDLILMDINIKGSTDGIQLARKILIDQEIPIVFITAHSDQDTFEEVLELSPYGFISKPFSAKDVAMTIQVAYKRYMVQQNSNESSDKKETQVLHIDEHYKYSKTLKLLYRDNEVVKLGTKHQELINVLCANANTTVDYMTLTAAIWGSEEVSGSSLRTLVYMLRKQLPDLPLISHSKVGYSIVTQHR
ncbi:MAG: hypothetical protein DSZ10_03115 [Sulfurovum sp.]|nr:MAG: hypothetical protein DSZ10_03115 [Sulfurovum sp.]